MYDSLKCKIKALEPTHKMHKMLKNYLAKSSKSKVVEIFEIERENEAKKFNPNKL